MKITYTAKNNTYGDISIGDCFQILNDETQCLYIKIPSMLFRNCEVNALNLNDMYELVNLENTDIVIPVNTELKVFTN